MVDNAPAWLLVRHETAKPTAMLSRNTTHHNRYEAAREMTRHFFEVDQLTVAQDQRLRSVFDDDRPSHSNGGGMQETGDGVGRNITPAVVEQLAGEVDYVDDFIGALEAL